MRIVIWILALWVAGLGGYLLYEEYWPGATGNLIVLADQPGAKVWLDRVPAGRTPVVVLNVAVGTRLIEVEAEGFRRFRSTVNVAPNRQAVVRNRLKSVSGRPGERAADLDLDELGKLSPDSVPAVSELPEAADLEPVRKLLSERKYDEAFRRLDEMAGDEKMRKHVQRIALVRRLARLMEKTVACGYRQLRKAKGRDYVLTLRKGIQFAGTLVDVTDTEVVMNSAGTEHRLPLSSIGTEQVIRLASAELDPREPKNLVRFALLYAAEGEFEQYADQIPKASFELIREALRSSSGDVDSTRELLRALREIAS